MKAKRLICTVLTLVLLVGVMPMTASAEEVKNYDNYTEYIFTMNDGSGYTMAVYNDGTCYVRDAYPGNSGECWFDQSWDKRHGDVVATKYVIEAGITHVIGVPISTVSVTLADSVIMFDTDGGRRDFREIIWGNNVQTIRYGGFKNCTSLTSIAIPDTVTDMGGGLFVNCTSLSSVSLPSHLTIIPQHTFENCTSLSSISLPDNVEVIEDYAFYNTALSSITLPEGFLSINHHAFENTNISSISFPESLIGIGINAFAGTPLTEVVIPESVTYIGDGAFPAGEQFTIYGYRNTHAQWFAEGNGNTFIPLDDCDLSIKIKEDKISKGNIAAGTVVSINNADAESMSVDVTLTAENDHFTDVVLTVQLPDGFSFEPDKLVKEKTVAVNEVVVKDMETTVTLPAIYPIYLSDLDSKEIYKMTISAEAKDSVGETVSTTKKCGFFQPDNVWWEADIFHDEPGLSCYIEEKLGFDLDAAAGTGNTYCEGTAKFASAMALGEAALHRLSYLEKLTREYGFTNRTGNFASKKVIINDELVTLIWAVAPGYKKPDQFWSGQMFQAADGIWGSFDVGSGDTHQYYQKLSNQFIAQLESYCASQQIALYKDTDFRLLITGCGDAAGSANLTGHYLNLTMENSANLSVYTFGAPGVVRNEAIAASGSDNNIFNIIELGDLFLNSPSIQLYGRYGNTYIYNTRDYGDRALLMSSVAMKRQYTSPWQHNILLFNEVSASLPLQDISDLFSSARYSHHVQYYADRALGGAYSGKGMSVSNAISRLEAAYENFLEIRFRYDRAHEVNVFHCPVNVYIDNAEGQQVACIENSAAVSGDDNVLVSIDGESKYVSVADGMENQYTIRVVPYDNGTMSHGVATVSDDCTNFDMQLRAGIPLRTGETYYVSPGGYMEVYEDNQDDASAKYVYYSPDSDLNKAFELAQLEFSDVMSGDWFYKSVYAAVPAGFIAGNPDGTFNPNGTLSWAQAIAFAVRLNQYNCGEAVKVPDGYVQTNWYDFYMEYALERGLIDSVPSSPNASISRGDAAIIFARVLGNGEAVNTVPDNYFVDVPTSGEAHDAVYALAEAGITVGMGGTSFGFDSTFRRSEAAAIVARMAGLVNPAKFSA